MEIASGSFSLSFPCRIALGTRFNQQRAQHATNINFRRFIRDVSAIFKYFALYLEIKSNCFTALKGKLLGNEIGLHDI